VLDFLQKGKHFHARMLLPGQTPPRSLRGVRTSPIGRIPRQLNLDRFLPDEGIMRAGESKPAAPALNPDEFASLRLILSAHTGNNANFSQPRSALGDIPVTASGDDPQIRSFLISP